MKMKQFVSVIMAACMLLTLAFPVGAVYAGTQTDIPEGYTPVYDAGDLNDVRNNLTGNYILMNDIVFVDADFEVGGTFYNSGSGWLPIGSETAEFNGIFDGNGKVIDNLYCNNSASIYVGLFAWIGTTGVVKNLGIINSSFYSNQSSIPCAALCGGLRGTVENCFNYNTSVTGAYDTGGLVGYAQRYSNVRNCFNSGVINSERCSGGIVGGNSGTISNCYNVGSLQYSSYHANGIVGAENAYNSIVSCYYLADGKRSGGLTDAQMQLQTTYAGFDFENIWVMSAEPTYPYPVLWDFFLRIHAEPSTATNEDVTITITYPAAAVVKEFKIGDGLLTRPWWVRLPSIPAN